MDLESTDIYDKIVALNPNYVSATHLTDPYTARVNDLCFVSGGRMYLIFADAYVFTSVDGFQSLEEIKEINYCADGLISQAHQSIDAVVETMDSSVLFVGRDRRNGSESGFRDDGEFGIVWRKPQGATSFTRTEVTGSAWMTSKSGNMTAGFFGSARAKMIALGIYGSSDAHFYYSLDDGLTWRKQSMTDCFAMHVHELYLPKSVNPRRKARLWVTGGDDSRGERSGVVCFDSLLEDGSLAGLQKIFSEIPGYRVVGINGNGRHVFIGNESLAGGVLKIQDNQESIDNRDFEYVLGKVRHDYHQFRALVATADGILVSGSSSYGYISDTVRADSGGYLYVSNNEGASFIEVALGTRWVTTIAYDGSFFWFAVTDGREAGADIARDRFRIYKLRKPSPYAELATPYVAKTVICDTSTFYEFAGYEAHPHSGLDPNERTMRADMTSYRTVVLAVETLDAGTLVVEAVPFYNWSLQDNMWYEALTLDFLGPERREVLLPETVIHNKYLRVRNAGDSRIRIRFVAFIGKK